MTIPFICVFAGFALNYLTKIPVALAMAREGKGYDNKSPREQQTRLTGWGKRALAAHQNSFEVAPLFAACVIIGHLTQGDEKWRAILSVAFIASRILYIGLYLADLDWLRSLAWMAGIACCFGTGLI